MFPITLKIITMSFTRKDLPKAARSEKLERLREIQDAVEATLVQKEKSQRLKVNGEGSTKVTKAWKRVERILKKNGYLPFTEDGCLWLEIIKVNKLHLRKTGEFEYDSAYVYVWYEDGFVYVGHEHTEEDEDDLFTCEIKEIEDELPAFLGSYFTSRMKNGKLKTK